MNSLIIGVTLASAAAAQIVNGASMIPASMAYSAAPSAAAGGYNAGGSGYAAPSDGYAPPPPAASSADASSSGYAPPSYSGSVSVTSAPPSQYTPPPDMSYSSFMAGGYKSMSCGYGYSKASDGSCQSESWVSEASFFP